MWNIQAIMQNYNANKMSILKTNNKDIQYLEHDCNHTMIMVHLHVFSPAPWAPYIWTETTNRRHGLY